LPDHSGLHLCSGGKEMMSDIVERLRYQRTNSVICNEAATEIERLRKIIVELTEEELKYESAGKHD
jgi:hypothetical protein